jgi:hypothetical protein
MQQLRGQVSGSFTLFVEVLARDGGVVAVHELPSFVHMAVPKSAHLPFDCSEAQQNLVSEILRAKTDGGLNWNLKYLI